MATMMESLMDVRKEISECRHGMEEMEVRLRLLEESNKSTLHLLERMSDLLPEMVKRLPMRVETGAQEPSQETKEG